MKKKSRLQKPFHASNQLTVEARLETAARDILEIIGDDPSREGLLKTPERFAQSILFLTGGMRSSLDEIVNGAVFTDQIDDMVIIRDIEFFSLCEHHILPFFGKCHIGYIPDGKIIGVSKLARITDFFARRLQIQERLTQQIAQTLMDVLTPLGVAVVMEAQHMCMTMRGVEKQHSKMVTSAMLGCFRDEAPTRAEFMSLIKS